MTALEAKNAFEKSGSCPESHLLTFHGVEGYDVYNCSVPIQWHNQEYIYGRVEKREKWASSITRLFRKTGHDEYTVVPDSMIYPLEDPFVTVIHGELILGGTHVQKKNGEIDTFYGYFYRGKDPEHLEYYTTGPANMKDIRLVEMKNGRIGVFSRPRGKHIREEYGSESLIGWTVISTLEELNASLIASAEPIQRVFGNGEWGGCNQCYLLQDGKIGVIGHKSFHEPRDGTDIQVYMNVSFVLDPETATISEEMVIGTAGCYTGWEPKVPYLADCTFASGIIIREDNKADLYAGVGDTCEGRLVIENPFAGHGGVTVPHIMIP